MFKKQRLLAFVLIFVLAMSSVVFAVPNSSEAIAAPNENATDAFDRKITARVDAERALEHIRYLSEEVGTRPGGMESEWRGAEYIRSVFESYGYEVKFQPFAVADQYIGKIVLPDGQEWELGSMRNSLITEDAIIEGEVIFANNETPTEDMANKIVLIERASSWTDTKNDVDRIVSSNAKAVIIYSVVGSRGNYGSTFTSTLNQETNIPVLGAAYIQGVWLKEMLENGPVTIKVQTKHYSNLESLNVIATKPAKNGDQNAPVVVVGGHMDSVVGAPGANDDASGVALVLELARILRGYNTDKEIRFMAFGSEERGLLGSKYYVNQLDDQEKSRIIGMFSPDMVATNYEPATNLYAMSVDGKPNPVTDACVAAGARLGNSDILPGKFGSSDHVPFYNAGIPAALFIRMDLDWEPETGVIDNYVIEKVYHTPQDTVEENVSVEKLQSALDIICSAAYSLIRNDIPALNSRNIVN